MFECLKFLLALVSLCGVILNVRRQRACFAVWTGTNAAWCLVDLHHGIPAQAALMAVYTGLAVWGWFAWRKS